MHYRRNFDINHRPVFFKINKKCLSLNTIDLPNMKFGIYQGKSTCPRMTGICRNASCNLDIVEWFFFLKKSRTEKKFWEKNCLQLKCKQQLS